MSDTSRREFVIGATVVAAAFGLGSPIVLHGSAQASELEEKGFFTFKVGDVEVTTVFDGQWMKPHDAGFIRNATVEDTVAALKAAGYSGEAVPIPFTITFARTGGRLVMFDAGTGAQLAPTAGKLAVNMAAAGIDGSKIDTIIVTHFHPDHIFGLMQRDTDAQVYPQAEIIVPAAEYAFWTDEGVFNKLPEARHGLARRIQATLPKWKNLVQFDGEREVAPGIRSVPAHGHTPGHTVFHIGSGADQLMVLADTTNIPVLFARNPGWHVQFDGDPQAAEAMRRQLFDRAITEKAVITGYHYGMPGAGRIEKDGAGYAFVPLA